MKTTKEFDKDELLAILRTGLEHIGIIESHNEVDVTFIMAAYGKYKPDTIKLEGFRLETTD